MAELKRRLNSIELLLIGFAAIYPLFANPFFAPVFGLPKLVLLEITAIAITSAWLVASIRNGGFELRPSRLRLPLIALVVAVILSIANSVHPLTSFLGQYGRWEGGVTLLCYGVLYLGTYALARRGTAVRPFAFALLGSAAIVSLIAIVEHFWKNPYLLLAKVYCSAGYGAPNAYEVGRSMAAFGNPTFLAAYLALALPLGFSRILSDERSAAPRWTAYAFLLLASTALLFTYGRAAWIGATLGIILIALLDKKRFSSYRAHIAAALLVILLAAAAVQVAGGAYSVTGRVASLFKLDSSNLTRVQMWKASLPLIAERPLLGSGPDTFKYVFGKYKPEGWVSRFSEPLVDKAHSDALQVFVTNGALGILAYLWVLLTFVWGGVAALRGRRDVSERSIALGSLAGALAYAVQLQFNFSQFAASPFFWMLLGLASGLLLVGERATTVRLALSQRQRLAGIGVITALAVSLAMLSLIPLAADSYYEHGRGQQADGQLAEATASYERAVALSGREPLYDVALAEAYFKLAAMSAATQRGATTLAQNGQAGQADSYRQLGQQAFVQAQLENPLDEQVYFRAGAAYLAAGRELNQPGLLRAAIDAHNRGLLLNPIMVDAYIDTGVAYAYLRDYDRAIDAWRQALDIDPASDRTYFNLGWAYEQKGERLRAKEAYLKAYQLNHAMPEAKAAYDRL